jgi:hypothetical protein
MHWHGIQLCGHIDNKGLAIQRQTAKRIDRIWCCELTMEPVTLIVYAESTQRSDSGAD